MDFSAADEKRIQTAAEQLEARTGVEVLAMVVGKSDHYPELPWKAFGLGASLAALAVTIRAVLDPLGIKIAAQRASRPSVEDAFVSMVREDET